MSERKHRGDRSPQRRPAEGVRIIPADEAQAALDAGEATGRRSDDELRYGDVPPAPQGPRSPHRFPLPDSVDPAGAVSLPPLAPSGRGDPGSEDVRTSDRDDSQPALWGGQPAAAPVPEPTPDKWGIGERTAELGLPAAVVGAELPSPGRAEPPRPPEANRQPPAATTAPTTADEPAFASRPDRAVTEPAYAASSGSGNRSWSTSAAGPGASSDWVTGSSGYRPEASGDRATPGGGGSHSATGAAWASGSSGATGSGSGWRTGQPDEPAPASGSAGRDADPGGEAGAPAAPRSVEPTAADEPSPLAPPEEGITVTGGGTELPHWTDPPTGEVPRILADDPRDAEPGDDDLAAWNALGSRSMRWRDDSAD